jgi:integral membrane protein
MKNLLTTSVGWLRLIGLLEGISLLILIGIAVPLKYAYADASWVKAIGPMHGMLFLLFIVNTLYVSVEQRWTFSNTTWKVLLSCLIPFGTIYIDRKILRHLPTGEMR